MASVREGESLPESVRDALRSRLRKLPESTAKTLSIAAAIGSIVDVDLLQSLINQNSEFEFFDILDDLIGREAVMPPTRLLTWMQSRFSNGPKW